MPPTAPSATGIWTRTCPTVPSAAPTCRTTATTTHDSDITFNEEQDGKRQATRRRRFHFPWGLVIILGAYAAGSYAYIRNKELSSPSFIAGNHYRAAMQILGDDNGSSAPVDSLQSAYAHLIESLSVFPDDKGAHDQLEQVRMVMVRRGSKPLPDLQRKADFLAAAFQDIQSGRRHALPVGMRDEWDVDAAAAAPGQLARYAVFGGLVIVLLWAYKQMQEFKFASKLSDERHLDRREELKHLHSHRPQTQEGLTGPGHEWNSSAGIS